MSGSQIAVHILADTGICSGKRSHWNYVALASWSVSSARSELAQGQAPLPTYRAARGV
ncbi:hypothetical protein LAL4801_01541 [Roseibium aggregatum]|uniref:Uncharacterized protein n=1 Tax=Roseibium aggregatum TaxID=187304 RepID=A0A0M6XZ16_9HYPH|nr:hypothetical protein LAL4801_01541 [Roseibium aggregatum]